MCSIVRQIGNLLINRPKKWKLLVIYIWILLLVASSIGCISLQRANVYETAKTELIDQSEIISRQFASLVDTNFYTRAALHDRLLSKVKAIAFVLEGYDSIDRANDFLEDIISTTEVKNLWIYDRSGNTVFGSGATPKIAMEPDDIRYLLDSRDYELFLVIDVKIKSTNQQVQ